MSTQVCLLFKDAPLRDVLKGLEQTGFCVWTRTADGTLTLKEKKIPIDIALFQPHSQAQGAMYAAGRQFICPYSSLPPAPRAGSAWVANLASALLRPISGAAVR